MTRRPVLLHLLATFSVLVICVLVILYSILRNHYEAIERVKNLGGKIETEWNGPAWLEGLSLVRRWPGFDRVVSVDLESTEVSDDDLAVLADFQYVRSVNLAATSVGDAGIGRLGQLSRMEELVLIKTEITDASLAFLPASLTKLYLGETSVGSPGVCRLAAIPSLVVLDLRGTDVDDSAMACLGGADSLEIISISGTRLCLKTHC